MTRPCSSAWTKWPVPGLLRYAASCAGVGSCAPEFGGLVRYLTFLSVCPRPSSLGLITLQLAAFAAAARSVILRPGIEPDGQSPEAFPPPELLSPPDDSAIAAPAMPTAATSTPATT